MFILKERKGMIGDELQDYIVFSISSF